MKKTTTPKKTAKESPAKEAPRKPATEKEVVVAEGLKKTYLKSRSVCKVIFFLPAEAVPGAKKVAIAGDFNQWDTKAAPMKKQKDGSFQLALEIPSDHEYRFKYLIDDKIWENDWCADKYVKNEFGGEDSVIQV
ncbi:MAG: isoamylase early set domain-containing protein [Nitrospiraceae bacterium]|nr:isoamylase early set domain-containing protein [Nitrospiraceae bacterium]